MWIVAGFLFFPSILPGFPKIPLIVIGGILAVLGFYLRRGKKEKEEIKPGLKKEKGEVMKEPESVFGLLRIDPIAFEIGYNLIPLVDPDQGDDLLERVTMIRRQSAIELGLIFPPIRIRDNMRLEPNMYSIKIKGVEVGKGTIRMEKYLAVNPGSIKEKIEGEETVEPAFGLPAFWIDGADRERAEKLGYTVVDAPSVIATHLTEIIKTYASEVLGRQDVQALINSMSADYPTVVREGVSIRDHVTIMETIADYFTSAKDPDELIELVRQAFSRQICRQFSDQEKKIPVITISGVYSKNLLK